jgi:Tfp pilus assembly protein PilP
MKLTTAILTVGIMTAAAWAQSPDATKPAAGSQGQAVAAQSAPAKPAAAATAKPATSAAARPAATSTALAPAAKNNPAPDAKAKRQDIFTPKKPVKPPAAVAKSAPAKPAAKKGHPTTKIAAVEAPADAAKTAEAPKPPKPEEKKWSMTGKRDPFFSPVVQQNTGSGCSTGKKCLEIGQINVRGVVKSDGGFIAVVTNSLNKAYFLHENDPVFNGYVVKITGDSVVFQETFQDKLGKPLTREIVKRIVTPAV